MNELVDVANHSNLLLENKMRWKAGERMRAGGFPSRERGFNLSEEISRNGRVEGSEDKIREGISQGLDP